MGSLTQIDELTNSATPLAPQRADRGDDTGAVASLEGPTRCTGVNRTPSRFRPEGRVFGIDLRDLFDKKVIDRTETLLLALSEIAAGEAADAVAIPVLLVRSS